MISTVDSFRGQELARGLLAKSLKRGSLHGTILLLGQRGLGKTTLATIIARALTCENNRDDPRLWFCGECYACRTIAAGEQAEFVTLRPLGQDIKKEQFEGSKRKSKKDDEAGKHDYSIFHSAVIKPTLLSHRIFLFDEAHHLNEETGNQLLKLLEEAPRQTVFILATDKPELLLPTIHSRGQKITLTPEPEERLAEYLRSDFPDTPAEAVAEAAYMAAGRYVDAMHLAAGDDWREAVKALAGAVFKGRGAARLAQVLARFEYAAFWAKELSDTGLDEDTAKVVITGPRRNALQRQALITAYDRAAWWALKDGIPPPGFADELHLLKARINQNVNENLAQAAFEMSL